MEKCAFCGSSWVSDYSVTKCPFCNHVIVGSTQMPYSDMLILLSDVKKEYGIEVFGNALKLKGLLKDKAPELKKEIDLLSLAMKSGLYADSLAHVGEQGYYTVLQKNRHILRETYYLSEMGSSKITEWFCCLLEIDTTPTDPRPVKKSASLSVASGIRQAVKNDPIAVIGGKTSANDGEYHIAFHPKTHKKVPSHVGQAFPKTDGEYHIAFYPKTHKKVSSHVGQAFPKIDGEYHFCYKKSKH